MLKICVQIAIINTADSKSLGIVLMINFMHLDYAKIVISINTTKYFFYLFFFIISKFIKIKINCNLGQENRNSKS